MTADTPAVLYVSIDRSGLSPVPVARFHKHMGAEEWIPRDAVRVKPLEWGKFGQECIRAESVLGRYEIMWGFHNGQTSLDVPSPRRTHTWHPSREAAKAAAQADYEARILSALALPAPDEGAQEEGEGE